MILSMEFTGVGAGKKSFGNALETAPLPVCVCVQNFKFGNLL
nr:MAG TPA: Dynamin family [Bacteriophage sp.]